MDDRMKVFFDELRDAMKGLPQRDIDDAVGFYEEYLNDALESGKDIDAVFAGLEPPRQIAAAIRAETSIAEAEQSPNIRSFSGALLSAMRSISAPFTVFLLSLCLVPAILLVALFFTAAALFFAAAVVVAAAMLYMGVTSHGAQGLLGSVGVGLLLAGILVVCAYSLWLLGRLMIRLSALMLRRMTRKQGMYVPGPRPADAPKKPFGKKAVFIAGLSAAAAGLILFSIPGLPIKYFAIFNSMEPANVEVMTYSYSPAGIERLSLRTTHTNIRLRRGNTEEIIVAYEKVDWLECELGVNGATLSFTEKSNDTLPLFQLVQLHQNSADLTVTLPMDFDPMLLEAESYGGFIYSELGSADVSLKTTTGSIHISSYGDPPPNIHAVTGTGIIDGGETQPVSTKKGTEYTENNGSGHTVDARTTAGSIYISRISQ